MLQAFFATVFDEHLLQPIIWSGTQKKKKRNSPLFTIQALFLSLDIWKS